MPLQAFSFPFPETRFFRAGLSIYKFKIKAGSSYRQEAMQEKCYNQELEVCIDAAFLDDHPCFLALFIAVYLTICSFISSGYYQNCSLQFGRSPAFLQYPLQCLPLYPYSQSTLCFSTFLPPIH
uniref:Uncharacterized protein n=1 Tax=Sphaeramia orbicularis TaxID=375764 RepID=A0A672Y992_9TELE